MEKNAAKTENNIPEKLVITTDKNAFTIALRNLLDNAFKFSRPVTNPRIHLGAGETDSSVIIWVKDNDIGFDIKYQHKIFEMFQRLNVSEEFPGTGIGLAMVYKAMERIGGRIWAESVPGKGATFYIEVSKI